MSRSETLHIRVTPEVRELVEAAAKEDRRTVSDWGAGVLEQVATQKVSHVLTEACDKTKAKKVRR